MLTITPLGAYYLECKDIYIIKKNALFKGRLLLKRKCNDNIFNDDPLMFFITKIIYFNIFSISFFHNNKSFLYTKDKIFLFTKKIITYIIFKKGGIKL